MLGHAVAQLMPDDVDARGRLGQDLTVAVAEEHVANVVPEGVVVVLAVVDHAQDRQTLAVYGIALKHGPVEVVGIAETVVGLVDSGIGNCDLTFAASDRARGLGGTVLLIVDRALRLATDAPESDRPSQPAAEPRSHFGARQTEQLIELQRVERGIADHFVARSRET